MNMISRGRVQPLKLLRPEIKVFLQTQVKTSQSAKTGKMTREKRRIKKQYTLILSKNPTSEHYNFAKIPRGGSYFPIFGFENRRGVLRKSVLVFKINRVVLTKFAS